MFKPASPIDPGLKKPNSDRERSLVYSREKRIKKCIQSREQRGTNVIGSWGKPMGMRAAVQGRPFAFVRAHAANTHQPKHC